MIPAPKGPAAPHTAERARVVSRNAAARATFSQAKHPELVAYALAVAVREINPSCAAAGYEAKRGAHRSAPPIGEIKC